MGHGGNRQTEQVCGVVDGGRGGGRDSRGVRLQGAYSGHIGVGFDYYSSWGVGLDARRRNARVDLWRSAVEGQYQAPHSPRSPSETVTMNGKTGWYGKR